MTPDLGLISRGEIFSGLMIEVKAVEKGGYVISREKSKLAAILLRIKNRFV